MTGLVAVIGTKTATGTETGMGIVTGAAKATVPAIGTTETRIENMKEIVTGMSPIVTLVH